MTMMTGCINGTPRPLPDASRLYTTAEVAALFDMKVPTLRAYIRRQHRVVPRRVAAAAHGVMVFDTSDILLLWQFIQQERGY